MKKYLFATVIIFAASRAYCQEYSSDAGRLAHAARLSAIGSRGAVQVTQVHSEAQTEIQSILVKQGDNNLTIGKAINSQIERQTEQLGAFLERIRIENTELATVVRDESVESRKKTLLGLENIRKEITDNRTQVLSLLETLRKEMVNNSVQSLASLETLRKETVDNRTQLLGLLESYRKETGNLVKYLSISLAAGFVAILSVLVAIYVQLRKTAQQPSR